MESLLKAVNSLELELRNMIDKTHRQEIDNTRLSDLNQAKDIELAEKERLLTVREEAVSKIEDVIKTRDDAVALRKLAEDLLAEAKDEKAKNKKANEVERMELGNLRELVDREQKEIHEKKILLKRDWEDLNAKKKSYREEVLAEIGKKVRG